MNVAGVEADIDRRTSAETGDEFSNLLEGRAQRKLSPRRVLDEYLQLRVLPWQSINRALNGLRRKPQSLIARKPLPASRMHHQILRAQRQRLLHFRAEGVGGTGADALGLRAKVDQETGVDRERMHIELRAQRVQLLGIRGFHRAGLPGAGAGAEYLQRVAAGFDRTFDPCPDAAAGAHVCADSLLHY